MKSQFQKIMGVLLCFLLVFGSVPDMQESGHTHTETIEDHAHEEADTPFYDGEGLLPVGNGFLGNFLKLFAVPIYANYEDGTACEYCGSYRYDDWLCENGEHCGEGSGTSCYEEHHCGYCGACDDDHELCDDCGNCLEDHCECEDKCRGCYELGETVCKDCGEKCSGCAWVCDSCEKCLDCVGDELYCSNCDICFDCADWVCYCGEGCNHCALSCPGCRESCSSCDATPLCQDCWWCMDCRGGAGDFCTECNLCKYCVEAVCLCRNGCSECTLVCEECGEKCDNCGEICPDCELCGDCCNEKAETFGCGHGICPKSMEWKNHYCIDGGHCVGTSAKTEHDEDTHWTVCGDGCENRINAEPHTFGEGRITKEAAKKAVGVLKFTCTVCDLSREETIACCTGE